MQPEIGIHYPKTAIGILSGKISTQMNDLCSIFKSEESKSMVAEAMEEYALAYEEEAYEDHPEEQEPMGFMATGGGFNDGNYYHW